MRALRILIDNGRVKIEPRTPSVSAPHRPTLLTLRETEVLKFVVEGLTNRETAVEMNVSIKTIEKHRQSVMDKLCLHDTAALTRYAVAHGLTFDEPSRKALAERWRWYSARQNAPLTGRETQVLKLIANGLVNKQIASELNISIKTVMNHREALIKRLDIHEVAGLTRYAISSRLINPAMLVPRFEPQRQSANALVA